jgi:hypothetical protein
VWSNRVTLRTRYEFARSLGYDLDDVIRCDIVTPLSLAGVVSSSGNRFSAVDSWIVRDWFARGEISSEVS